MPEWLSADGRGRLALFAESLAGRFEKLTGQCSYQGTNAMVVHEDHNTGLRRTFIAEQMIVSEDAGFVYFRAEGQFVEQTERIGQTGRASARRARGEEVQVGIR